MKHAVVEPPHLEMKCNVGKYIITYNCRTNLYILVQIIEFNRGEAKIKFLQIAGSSENGKTLTKEYDRGYFQMVAYTTEKEGREAFKYNCKQGL